jgi:hypothetical protein
MPPSEWSCQRPRLSHPGIVGIYEVGEQAGCPYLALEFVAGGTLARQRGGTPVPPRRAAQLLLELARAVQHAHEQGIVHRDRLWCSARSGCRDRTDLESCGGVGNWIRSRPSFGRYTCRGRARSFRVEGSGQAGSCRGDQNLERIAWGGGPSYTPARR